MVTHCPECGDYAYATRIQDQVPLICRSCRYYNDPILEKEGFDLEHEINDRSITKPREESYLYDEEKWDWEPHEL